MEDMCQLTGHSWYSTAAPGWFRCRTIVELKRVRVFPEQWKSVLCDAVAHCPGCLGYRLEGYAVVFCAGHQGCRVEDFLVHASSAVSSSQSSDVEQRSLFE